MIARVRIAHVDRWCPESEPGHKEVGLWVEIIIESMGTSRYCSGRKWLLTEESKRRLYQRTGMPLPSGPVSLCEHMLEMD